ncbi:Methyltransferase [Aratus pisonii nudivirus]|nr:Methyltransferase [Aratus pisonii nudivirus]
MYKKHQNLRAKGCSSGVVKKYHHNNRDIIDQNTLKLCGMLPSKYKDKISYKYKNDMYILKSTDQVQQDKVYVINDNVELPDLKYEYVVSEPTGTYNCETVYNYESVKNLINKLFTFKDLLSSEELQPSISCNIKKLNVYSKLVRQYSSTLLNVCSLKLLNINYTFDNIIGKSMKYDTLYADLCSAPGGFTYLLQSIFCNCKVTGFLTSMPPIESYLEYDPYIRDQNNCNFRLNVLYGDIRNQNFRIQFANHIGFKVAFVLADGGVDFKGQENFQEYIMRDLCLAQMLMGMMILKPSGFMICKYFDTFSKYMLSVLFLLKSVFKGMIVCKPVSSKAGNAEKYILFKDYQPNADLVEYFERILNLDKSERDKINNLVKIEDNHEFYNSMMKINKNLVINQNSALQKYLGKIKIEDMKSDIIYNTYKSWVKTFKN